MKFPQQHHGCFSPPGTRVTSLLGGGRGGTGGTFQSDSAIPSQTHLSQILSTAPPTTLGIPPETQGKPPFLHPFISPKLSPGSSCVPSVSPSTEVLRSLSGKEGHVYQSTPGQQGHPKTSLGPKPSSHPSAARSRCPCHWPPPCRAESLRATAGTQLVPSPPAGLHPWVPPTLHP